MYLKSVTDSKKSASQIHHKKFKRFGITASLKDFSILNVCWEYLLSFIMLRELPTSRLVLGSIWNETNSSPMNHSTVAIGIVHILDGFW